MNFDIIVSKITWPFIWLFNLFVDIWIRWIAPYWYVYVVLVLFLYYGRQNKGNWIFGITIDLGAFGAWKTYNIFKEALDIKRKHNAYIISNNPYYFCDLHFNSSDDLWKVFKHLVTYFQKTNTKPYLESERFRPIVFILDEAHLYFFSRKAMSNLKDDNTMITVSQCRKRNILIRFITQELAQLDSTFRRLVPNVRKFYVGMFWLSIWREYHLVKDDTDVKNEEVAEIVGRWFFLKPGAILWRIKHFISKRYKQYHSERWVSRYIVGLSVDEHKNLLDNYTYDDFISTLYWDEGLDYLLKK